MTVDLDAQMFIANGHAAWNNDYEADNRKPKPSFVTVLSDVIMDDTGRRGGPLSLGPVLDAVDLCAGRTAYQHVEGAVVTVSIEYGRMLNRIESGDLLRVQSRVVDVGSSSLTIGTVILRERLSKYPEELPVFEEVMRFQLTFVAVSRESGRPYKNVPKLCDFDEAGLKRAEEARRVKSTIRSIENGQKECRLSSSSEEPWTKEHDLFHEQRVAWTAMAQTAALFSRQYLPRHENFGGIIFGGDVLLMLERAAVYCGTRFTRASHVNCIAVYDVHFKLPIKPTSILLATARVILVRQYCIEIEVVVNADHSHEGAKPKPSHSAYFTVVHHDGTGRLLPVKVGLNLEGADEEERRAHEKARFRCEAGYWIPRENEALRDMLVRTVVDDVRSDHHL